MHVQRISRILRLLYNPDALAQIYQGLLIFEPKAV